jgi:hypothetical protein
VRVDGKLRALEEFRLPKTFDPATVRVFNTNVFHIDARALLELDMKWRFYTVKKQVEGKAVVQFERILNEITGELDTVYLRLPCTGEQRASPLPVKDFDELERRRPRSIGSLVLEDSHDGGSRYENAARRRGALRGRTRPSPDSRGSPDTPAIHRTRHRVGR